MYRIEKEFLKRQRHRLLAEPQYQKEKEKQEKKVETIYRNTGRKRV